MSIDQYNSDYNYEYDIFILTKELEEIDRKIEIIQTVMNYCRTETYLDLLNQELYYYNTWKYMILEALGY
jgi:hypothetical protein